MVLYSKGKNPFTLDSKELTASYQEFINGEARYTRLAQQVSPAGSVTSGSDSPADCHSTPSVSLRYPERAKELFAKAEATAKAKYERLKKLVEFYNV